MPPCCWYPLAFSSNLCLVSFSSWIKAQQVQHVAFKQSPQHPPCRSNSSRMFPRWLVCCHHWQGSPMKQQKRTHEPEQQLWPEISPLCWRRYRVLPKRIQGHQEAMQQVPMSSQQEQRPWFQARDIAIESCVVEEEVVLVRCQLTWKIW